MKLWIKNSKTVSVSCYIYCNDSILVAKRGSTAPSNPDKWNVPVGMIDGNETPEQAMVREIREETGLDVSPSQLEYMGTQEWGDGINNGKNYRVILDGECSDYHIGEGDGECSKYQWVNISDTDEYDWAFGMGELIKEYYR